MYSVLERSRDCSQRGSPGNALSRLLFLFVRTPHIYLLQCRTNEENLQMLVIKTDLGTMHGYPAI